MEREKRPETFDEQVIARLKRLEGQISVDYAGKTAKSPEKWQKYQGMEMEEVGKVEWVILKLLEYSRQGDDEKHQNTK